ncbi:hypothetical protein LZ32DRAFT_672537 [Colletotrichum eremochloae]|nr:hypothetical protein LZ32DRAFT_672537 [Colletotrichum eremochloae]
MSSAPGNADRAPRGESPPRSRRRLEDLRSNEPTRPRSPHPTPYRPNPRDGNYHPPISQMGPWYPAAPDQVFDLDFGASAFGNPHTSSFLAIPVPDLLLRARLFFTDEQTPLPEGRTAKTHRDIVQKIIVLHDSFHRYGSHQRIAADFNWGELVKLIQTYCPTYEPEESVLHTTMRYRGKLLGSGTIRSGGEFSVAVDQLLDFAQEEVKDEQDSSQVEIHFAIQAGRPADEGHQHFGRATADPKATEKSQPAVAQEDRQDDHSDDGLADGLNVSDGPPEPKEVEEDETEDRLLAVDKEPAMTDDGGRSTEEDEDGSSGVEFLGSRDIQMQGDAPDHAASKSAGVEDLIIGNADDEKDWPGTCQFFNHKLEDTDAINAKGATLPCTTISFFLPQMVEIYRHWRLVTAREHPTRGSLQAHEMGVGKTVIYLGIIAVRRLAFLSHEHFKRCPALHRSYDGRCALPGRPFGIQCACDKDGLTRAIVEAAPHGANLIVVPAHLLSQAWRDANTYFKERLLIDFPDFTQMNCRYFTFIDWSQVRPSDNRLKSVRADFHFDFDKLRKLPTGTHTSRPYSEKQGKRLLKAIKMKVLLTPSEDATDDADGVMLFLTQQRASRDQSWRNHFQHAVELEVEGTKRKAIIQYKGFYFYGLVVWDEAHEHLPAPTAVC